MNCPKLCGQYKNSLNGRKYSVLSNELTSHFEWCQFCFELDTSVITELYICTYEEARLLIGVDFCAINTFGFED